MMVYGFCILRIIKDRDLTGITVFSGSLTTSQIRLVCRVGVKYSTCTWYLYLSTYLSVLDVLEYLVYGNVKVLVLDQKVLGTCK